MVVKDSTLTIEDSPQDYGVEKRKFQYSDFSFTVKALIATLILLFGVLYPPIAQLPFGESRIMDVAISFGVLTSLATFFSFVNALGKPKREANEQADYRSFLWQNDVLIPYLEAKYGIRFQRSPGMLLNLFGWNFPYAYLGDRRIKVNVQGVDIRRNYKFDDTGTGFKYFVIENYGVTLEEVVEPEKISFRPLSPVN